MNVWSIVFKKFWSLTFVVVLLLMAQAHAGTLRRTTFESDDEHIGTEDIQRVIKDVIILSVKSEDGKKVDPLQMERAGSVGFKPQEVEQLVDLAQKKGDIHDITDFLDSVYIIPKEATQFALHHVEIIPKEEHTNTEDIQRVIKDVIISSVKKSEDGEKVDPLQMERARSVGFQSREVEQLVDLAQKKGDIHDITDFLDSVYIIPKEATQYSLHHVEIIPKEEGLGQQQNPAEKKKKAVVEPISAPHALANAIESAIHSENSKVDPTTLQVAIISGWTEEEVHQMTRMAVQSVADHDGDKSAITKDLELLRNMKKEQEKPKKEKEELLPLNTWTA